MVSQQILFNKINSELPKHVIKIIFEFYPFTTKKKNQTKPIIIILSTSIFFTICYLLGFIITFKWDNIPLNMLCGYIIIVSCCIIILLCKIAYNLIFYL